jgi:hypothetical protein
MTCPVKRSLRGNLRNDFLGRTFDELGAITQFLEFPLEDVSELCLSVDTQFVLLVIANSSRGEALEDHVDLVGHAGIGSRFGGRGKSARQISRQGGRELFQFFGIK